MDKTLFWIIVGAQFVFNTTIMILLLLNLNKAINFNFVDMKHAPKPTESGWTD